MISYEAIHHVSLGVTDLERAKEFYSGKLGFIEIDRPIMDIQGAWYSIGNQQLHLILYPPSQTIRTEGGIDTRDGHFAVRVKNYLETLQWLKKKEVEVVEKPNSKSGFAQIFCCDPDGNIIEFNTILV